MNAVFPNGNYKSSNDSSVMTNRTLFGPRTSDESNNIHSYLSGLYRRTSSTSEGNPSSYSSRKQRDQPQPNDSTLLPTPSSLTSSAEHTRELLTELKRQITINNDVLTRLQLEASAHAASAEGTERAFVIHKAKLQEEIMNLTKKTDMIQRHLRESTFGGKCHKWFVNELLNCSGGNTYHSTSSLLSSSSRRGANNIIRSSLAELSKHTPVYEHQTLTSPCGTDTSGLGGGWFERAATKDLDGVLSLQLVEEKEQNQKTLVVNHQGVVFVPGHFYESLMEEKLAKEKALAAAEAELRHFAVLYGKAIQESQTLAHGSHQTQNSRQEKEQQSSSSSPPSGSFLVSQHPSKNTDMDLFEALQTYISRYIEPAKLS